MRIISGSHKGKRLIAPGKLPVRPTTDMAKEALFNILNNYLEFSEITILDLFSGTGNISYEFASRGSKQITAVDDYYGCVKYIKQTASQLDFPIQTVKSDVFKYLENAEKSFDLIFADPPYDFSAKDLTKMHTAVFEKQLLKKDGYLIIEHSKHTKINTEENLLETRKYGNAVFSIFKQE